MRVAFSLLTLQPGAAGGAETYVRGTLGAFAEGGSGVSLDVLANDRVAEEYVPLAGGDWRLARVPGARIHEGAAGRLGSMAAMAARSRRWRGAIARYDVVHHPVTVPLPPAPGASVVSLLDVQHHELPEFFSPAERAFRRIAYDGAARRADVVITISHHAKGQISERLGIDPDRIVVSHLAVDRDRLRPEGAGDDDELTAGLDLPERFVLYPANLWPHKNHERLFEALARTPPEIALVLTGATYGRLQALLATAARHGVGDRVRHLGFVPADAVPALYRRARALVFPSLFEGFGLPPLEAMACGCPVAASSRGSLGEVCGDAALVFDPADVAAIAAAIERVVGDETVRTRLVRAGAQRAGLFTWAAAREAHVRAYRLAAG